MVRLGDTGKKSMRLFLLTPLPLNQERRVMRVMFLTQILSLLFLLSFLLGEGLLSNRQSFAHSCLAR